MADGPGFVRPSPVASYEHEQPSQPHPSPLPEVIAWEDPRLSAWGRIARTLGSSFRPSRSAQALAYGPLKPGISFAVTFALPFMLLWAIIPFTHTLQFEPGFGIEPRSAGDGRGVELDLAQAMAIGLGVSLISLATWAAALASLLRAFCPTAELSQKAYVGGLRTALYRAWIVPCGLSLFWLSFWALPTEPGPVTVELLILAFQLLPRLIVLSQAYAVAEQFGIRGGPRLLVVLVPLLVEWAAGLPLSELMTRLSPPAPAIAPHG